jgi:RecA-family ATPase
MTSRSQCDDLKPLRSIPVMKWQGQPIPERQWLVEDWIPWGCTTALYGDGGTGKSLLAQQLLTSVATGKPFLGMPVRQCKVMGMFCEDDEDELHRRQADINAKYDIDFGDLEYMTFVSRTSENNVLMTFDADGIGQRTPLYDQLLNFAKDSGVQFVVIDTVADTFGGNEIIRPHVQQFISHGLGGMAKALDGVVVTANHPSRGGTESGRGDGGSTAWSNSVRSRLYLERPSVEADADPDENARILSRKKSNYAKIGDEIRLRFEDGAFLPVQPAGNDQGGLFGKLRRDEAERVFFDGFKILAERGVRVNIYPNTPNYAPRQMRNIYTPAKVFTVKELDDASKRLLSAGRLRINEDGSPSRRRTFLALGEAGR